MIELSIAEAEALLSVIEGHEEAREDFVGDCYTNEQWLAVTHLEDRLRAARKVQLESQEMQMLADGLCSCGGQMVIDHALDKPFMLLMHCGKCQTPRALHQKR